MDLRVAIVPVGKIDPADVEAAAARISKVLNTTVDLRPPAPVPRAGDDPARGQHVAGPFLAGLRGPLVRPAVAPVVTLFVTDVDLYKPGTDGVFGDIDATARAAVLSVRRLREPFYKRKADPVKARARLVKLALYAIGRACGLPECGEPGCALSTTSALADIDMKSEKYCAACWRRLTTGAHRI
jgi:predicted Zn-dependent protease